MRWAWVAMGMRWRSEEVGGGVGEPDAGLHAFPARESPRAGAVQRSAVRRGNLVAACIGVDEREMAVALDSRPRAVARRSDGDELGLLITAAARSDLRRIFC